MNCGTFFRLGTEPLRSQDEGRSRSDGARNVLCVVAHPDDEALGVGGTLIRHVRSGDRVGVVILSDGEGAKKAGAAKDPERIDKASAWARVTGCSLLGVFDFPDQRLDTVPMVEIVDRLEKSIREFNPDIVYTHHPGDLNHDHRIACNAVLVALRPMHANGAPKDIYAFETPSSTDQAPNTAQFSFQPNHYVVLDDLVDEKMNALEVYSNELGDPPHPRSRESIRALATKRGAECGALSAEAFVLLRSVWSRPRETR
jgi:N-acetylglucosamine malate deacetylase 1